MNCYNLRGMLLLACTNLMFYYCLYSYYFGKEFAIDGELGYIYLNDSVFYTFMLMLELFYLLLFILLLFLAYSLYIYCWLGVIFVYFFSYNDSILCMWLFYPCELALLLLSSLLLLLLLILAIDYIFFMTFSNCK